MTSIIKNNETYSNLEITVARKLLLLNQIKNSYQTKCGPKSWKLKNNIHLEYNNSSDYSESNTDSSDYENNTIDYELLEIEKNKPKLVRSINSELWDHKLQIMKSCKFKDIFVDIHYVWDNNINDFNSEISLEYAYVYVILSLYINDEIKYNKITATINKKYALKKYNQEYNFDITDYILRNKDTWVKQTPIK
jgi:hypothetical protein